jgi:hypothetical protein
MSFNLQFELKKAEFQAEQCREILQTLLSYTDFTDHFIIFTYYTDHTKTATFELPMSDYRSWQETFTALQISYKKRIQTLHKMAMAN